MKLILHHFPPGEQNIWKNDIFVAANEEDSFSYVFSQTEIEINHYIVQEKFDLVVCYLLPNRKPNKEFWRYLSSSLRVPVILVRKDPEPNEMEFFDFGVEDIFDLNRIENNLLLRLFQKVYRRSQVRKKEAQLLRLESEGIVIRDPVVLIVEDDSDLLSVLMLSMRKFGYIVHGAHTFSEAIMLFAEKRPDVVLCDYSLPDATAEKMLIEIDLNKQSHDVAFFIMSGDSTGDWRLKVIYDIEDVFTKPLNLQELEVRIRKALQRNLHLQRLQNQLQKMQAQRRIAERFISPEIMQRLEDGELPYQSNGHMQIATVVFFDLRDSTKLGNELEAKKFADMLNSILHDIMDLAVSNHGSINKMLGDGLMLTFGAPDPRRGTPEDAIRFALRTHEHFQMINEIDAFALGHGIDFGVGIATGDAFAGQIGSIHRMEFTVMGNVVNTASRLENMNKRTHTNILIDNQTYENIPAELQKYFRRFQVKIRGKGETRYTVWGNL